MKHLAFLLLNLLALRWLLSLFARAESSIWWTTGTTGDGTTTYTEAQLTAFFGDALTPNSTITNPNATYGVLPGAGGELAVTGTSSPVSVAAGAAITEGYAYRNTAAVTVAIPTPSVSTRIDRIVLRVSHSTTRTVRITRIAGTEGAGAPAITQTAGTTWDIKLAQASITTGGVITVTDERSFCHFATRVDMTAVDGGTAGRIPFPDSAGRLTGDANLAWDNTNKRLGIGDSTPDYPLDIEVTNSTATRTGDIGAEAAIQNNSTGGVRSAGLRFRVVDTATTIYSAARVVASFLAGTFADAVLIFQTVSGVETFQDVMTLRGTKVGIGTTSPAKELDVVGQAQISPASAAPPFVLGANGQDQKVTGLKADAVVTLGNARRQGGNATDWNAAGTTNYTPPSLKVQMGVVQWTGSALSFGTLTVTFPTAFGAKPIMFAMLAQTTTTDGIVVSTGTITDSTTACDIGWRSSNGTNYTSLAFVWIAYGAE